MNTYSTQKAKNAYAMTPFFFFHAWIYIMIHFVKKNY